jgi:hypothetical protein
VVDPHTIASFAFAQMRRDPAFGSRFPWVRNTVVCVESDLMDDVLTGQMVHYFRETGGTVACYFPRDQRFMFVYVGKPVVAEEGQPPPQPTPGVRQMEDSREHPMTVGEIVNAIYEQRNSDFSYLPTWSAETGIQESHWGKPLVGEASTVEIEKQLALT